MRIRKRSSIDKGNDIGSSSMEKPRSSKSAILPARDSERPLIRGKICDPVGI